MSKPATYLVTFVVCLLLQVCVAPAIAVGGCSPRFLLIPVVLVSLRSGAAAGGFAGFVCGLFVDLDGSGTVGCMALAFTLVALLVGVSASVLDAFSPGPLALVGVVSSCVCELGYGVASVLSSSAQGGVLATLVGYSLPCAVYTAVFLVVALVTIHYAMADDTSALSGSLGGTGLGSGSAKVPRITSRLK